MKGMQKMVITYGGDAINKEINALLAMSVFEFKNSNCVFDN